MRERHDMPPRTQPKPAPGWSLPALNAVMARHAPGITVTAARRFANGFWNHVLHLSTSDGDLVLKHYRPMPDNSLFPNLPQDEARALQRLQGLQVAPDLVALIPDDDILIYRYVPGPEWQGDVAAAAHLMRRQSLADPAGFRAVPVTAADILAEADRILAQCRAPALPRLLQACRPVPRPTAPAPFRLIHTDPAPANLVGSGAGLRLIDWQCPAAGDLAQDIATLLSPAFLTLYARPLPTDAERALFLQTLADPALTDRLPHLEPAYGWRLACYCAHRAETAADPDLAARYAAAAQASVAQAGAAALG